MHRRQNKNLNNSKGQRDNIFLYGEKFEGEINIETQISKKLYIKEPFYCNVLNKLTVLKLY